MSFIFKFSKINFAKNINWRSLSISPSMNIKEIKAVEEGDTTIISADILPSEREPYVLKNVNEPHVCPLCASGLDVKHTDVLILSQFLRSDGCMLPRRITGLCKNKQKRVATLVAMAQKAGLMPNMNPSYSKKDPRKRYAWKKFNKYFDETTIKYK